MMILGSLTLLPALLGWVGPRIDNTSRAALIAVGLAVVGALVGFVHRAGRDLPGRHARWRSCFFAVSFVVKPLRKLDPAPRRAAEEQRFWYRWSRFIQHRPWPSMLGAARRC